MEDRLSRTIKFRVARAQNWALLAGVILDAWVWILRRIYSSGCRLVGTLMGGGGIYIDPWKRAVFKHCEVYTVVVSFLFNHHLFRSSFFQSFR